MINDRFFKGQFLIAESELGDPHFVETVVLVVDHDENGAFGLVVNRKSHVSLGSAAPTYHDSPFAGVPLYVGGPVEQQYLFTLHAGLPEGFGGEYARPITEGVVFEPDFGQLERYILSQPQILPPVMRLFAGYSGWGPGQLESERAEGAWALMPATPDLVFNPHPDRGWRDALRRKGGIYSVIAETGSKPSLN